MPTLNQMRTAINNWVDGKWSTIVARQENFRTNRGRYWQGLKTHLVPPAHTNSKDDSKVGDRLNESPDDQGAFSTWLNVFPEWLTELLPASVQVDVYEGTQGHGWTLTVEATHNGDLWRRVVNVGPESHRAQAWHKVPPFVPPG